MRFAMRRSSGTPSARRSRLGRESGQAVVEFAMVVPILCVLVLVLVDFGKGMNYWLDLNHVASEVARKAAVNTFPTAGEYQSYALDKLETNELRAGGTDAIPAAANVAICLPEGGDVGDPVTVQVSVGYHWIPFIDHTDWQIRGTATMRLEQKALFSGVGTCA
jgi:TadE-like protein